MGAGGQEGGNEGAGEGAGDGAGEGAGEGVGEGAGGSVVVQTARGVVVGEASVVRLAGSRSQELGRGRR